MKTFAHNSDMVQKLKFKKINITEHMFCHRVPAIITRT